MTTRIIDNFYQSTQILLNSKNATRYINDQTSNCLFGLNTTISKPKNHQLMIKLVTMNIPHSWYNINYTNDTLIYTVNSVTTTLTITNKNYNINDLSTYLNTNLSGFTITYNANTNKLTFYNSTYSTFSISSSSTCLTLLGLSLSNLSTTNNYLISDIGCDLSYTKSIYININLNLNTIDSRNDLNYNNVLTSIPIQKSYLSMETYINYNANSFLLYETQITQLNIYLSDDGDNVIDLNGVHWDANIIIEYIYNDAIDKYIPNDLLKQNNT